MKQKMIVCLLTVWLWTNDLASLVCSFCIYKTKIKQYLSLRLIMKIKIHKALKTTVKLIISFQLFLGLRNLFPLPDVLTSFLGEGGFGFMVAKQELYCLSHTSSPFYSDYFGDRVSQTICLRWPGTWILLISASQVARITGVATGARLTASLIRSLTISHMA
jgi:hypothetical protein